MAAGLEVGVGFDRSPFSPLRETMERVVEG